MDSMSNVSRRGFVAAACSGTFAVPLGLIASGSAAALAADPPQPGGGADPEPGLPPGFPSQDPALAREVVGKSHFDLDAVTKLVEARPTLALATWDWGFGDWESALGAASHVGRPDIAALLMAHGARPDIFTFTMLGNLDAVKAIIAANPGVQRIPGPHGITLLAHARAGGDAAKPVLDYLVSLGDADPVATDLPLSPELRAAILGAYIYELDGESGAANPQLSCTISETKSGILNFKHEPDGSARNLLHQGDGVFHPAGGPKVRIAFADGRLMIEDGAIRVAARKR
jgi:hypothetical protein